jgi:hypothetical protein
MTTFIDRITTRIRKHGEYRRTLTALRGLPPELARDLDIYPGLEREIALGAVYGK